MMPIRRMSRQRGSGNPELNVLEEGNDDVKGEGSKSGCFVESKMHVKWNHVNPDQFRQSGAHSSQIV